MGDCVFDVQACVLDDQLTKGFTVKLLVLCLALTSCGHYGHNRVDRQPGWPRYGHNTAKTSSAYEDSCKAALQIATRGGPDYPGHGYSDSRAAGEDGHYHNDPSSYDGKGGKT